MGWPSSRLLQTTSPFRSAAPGYSIPLEEAFWVAGLFLRQMGRAFEGGAEVPLALLVQRYAAMKSGR